MRATIQSAPRTRRMVLVCERGACFLLGKIFVILNKHFLIGFQVFEDYAGAARDRGQRIVSDMDGNFHPLRKESVDTLNESAPADKIDAAPHDVSEDFRRCSL